MAKDGPQAISLDVSVLVNLKSEIDALQTQVAAVSGNDAAVRKQIANDLAEQNADQIDSYVGQLVENLNTLEVPVLIGLRSKIEDALSANFDAKVKAFLDERVEQATAGSADNVQTIKDDIKAKIEEFRSVKTILDSFGVDTSGVEEPKPRRGRGSGSGAPKSPKNKEGYRYSLDGKERPDSQNLISALCFYSTVGCDPDNPEDRWSTKQLKSFLAEQGVNFGEDDTWEVTLPNGKVISARRFNDDELARIKELEDKS